MTLQEKAVNQAKQLVDKHYSELADLCVTEEVLDQIALNQALVTVNETLGFIEQCEDEGCGIGSHVLDYWNTVEEELINMGAY